MATVSDVARFLDAFAPPALAESWDNVGLLVGDASRGVDPRDDLPDRHARQCRRSGIAAGRADRQPSSAALSTAQALDDRHARRPAAVGADRRGHFDLQPAHGVRFGRAGHQPAPGRGLAPGRTSGRWCLADAGQGAGRYGRLPAAITLGELAVRGQAVAGDRQCAGSGPAGHIGARGGGGLRQRGRVFAGGGTRPAAIAW